MLHQNMMELAYPLQMVFVVLMSTTVLMIMAYPQLRRNKVQLHSVLENLDSSPESVILESVLEGMAEYYSKNLAREVRKGMKENALKCMSTGGAPPFGYYYNNEKKLEINELEAEGVRLIFRMILEGKGFDTIIHELNQQGFKTRYSKQFGKNSISSIIRNEKYKGVYVFNKASSKDYDGKRNSHLYKTDDEIIRIEDGIPAIISTVDFDAVQALIKGCQRKTANVGAKEVYLLSGRIFCGECGKSYIGNRKFAGGQDEALHIPLQHKGKNDKRCLCSNKEIRREYVERFVLERLSSYF
jgi:site-specific DNA recombinase